MGGPNAGLVVVLRGLLGDGKLAQVVADHRRLDFHMHEGRVVLDAHHAAHHLWQDDPVPAGVSSPSGFLVGGAFWLALHRYFSKCRFCRHCPALCGCVTVTAASRTCPAAGQGPRSSR